MRAAGYEVVLIAARASGLGQGVIDAEIGQNRCVVEAEIVTDSP